ncbi:MAG: Maf-like protein [gamma proteobacterium symbiont of Bathyaustriella thionipta]|nr:Maf-like protein [gamma proteobacterium symbiont of Bathyaustriella thionipta]
MKTLILASTSPFRKALLDKLGLTFECISPHTDETPLADESASALVQRLAISKAKSIAEQHANSLIIGSDQVAVNPDGEILGKPGNLQRASRQLQSLAGKRVSFYTGLCLLDTSDGHTQSCVEPFHVYFRSLSDLQIKRYLQREQPFNCAGSFKSEALGIALFEKMQGDDPNSLIGLPLIKLIDMLQQRGVDVI